MKRLSSFILLLSIGLSAFSQHEWLHIFRKDSKDIVRVTSLDLNDEAFSIKYINSSSTPGAFRRMKVSDSDVSAQFYIQSITDCKIGQNIPIIYIDIDNNAEVVEKDKYLKATISIKGNGVCDDFDAAEVNIKGRGNSTWNMPKKPYRLKFSKKQKFGGLPEKAKNFALIANFIDPTLMRNSVALKVAQMVGLPFTNHFTPVELIINGTYRGSYLLTEKIGINGASVDIDESTGILWEMDSNYDEDYKFLSPIYRLPLMVKDPDLEEIAAESGEDASVIFERWKEDFNNLEKAVAASKDRGADWTEYLDMESVVKYMFVYDLCVNCELNHPKSTYLYKASIDDKYRLGPVWDFDWAFTFSGKEIENRERSILLAYDLPGAKFFHDLCDNEKFLEAFATVMNDFKENHLDELIDFIDSYAELITPAAYHNGERWPDGSMTSPYVIKSSEHHEDSVNKLRTFILKRMEFMQSHPRFALF